MLARIAHTTDFSPQSAVAFAHALALALAARNHLDVLHVKDIADDNWQAFPHVREILARWGHLTEPSDPNDIAAKLGVHVSKVEIGRRDVIAGLSEFFLIHRPDLLVVATHGRHGINRWLYGSVSEEVARRTHVPTLLIGPEGRGFVKSATGEIDLRRVLVPVTPHPPPARQRALFSSLLSELGVTAATFELINISDAAHAATPNELFADVECLNGPVVKTILDVANERQVDLIAMATPDRHGLLDALRGHTTSRVVAEAPCPVLLLPYVSASAEQ